MDIVTESHLPHDIEAASRQLEGVAEDDLVRELSRVMDQVYLLRGVSAWAAVKMREALAYKGFSKSRRPYAEAQVTFFERAASGDVHKVIFDRQSQRVERAARRDLPGLPSRFTVPPLARTGQSSDRALRLTVAFAHRELFELRQFAAYEAGVTRVHDNPSGPKGVRTILENVDRTLLGVAENPDIPVRGFDAKAHLAAIGATTVLTRHSYERALRAQLAGNWPAIPGR